LLVANDFRILRSDFVAHSTVIGCSGLNFICDGSIVSLLPHRSILITFGKWEILEGARSAGAAKVD
jgi:hypothetical protein